MKKIITPLLAMALATIFSLSAKAQNLVPNASFEQHYSCPDGTDEIDSCVGWYGVLNSPDYFNECSPYPVSIPDNVLGDQFPFDGKAYAGLVTYYGSDYREIIGARLDSELIPGDCYHVSMRVSRANGSKANNETASNKIGMRFTTFAYGGTFHAPINNYAQVYTDSVITDSLNWVLVAWNYAADSAYSYVYIGNFFTNINTDTLNIGPVNGLAYYYIDSVNIVSLGKGNCFDGISPIKNNEAVLQYDINSHSIYAVLPTNETGMLTILNSASQNIKEAKISNAQQVNLSGFASGFYIALFQSSKYTLIKKIIIINH